MRIVHALMGQIIDYAGLFPPARLDMVPMVREYGRIRTGPDSWMLGRIIVPMPRLEEFEAAVKGLLPTRDEDAWALSVILSPLNDRRLEMELERIERFNEQHAARQRSAITGSALIDTVEIATTTPGEIDRLLDALPDHIFPYVEIPLDTDTRGLLACLVGSDAGVKIRTGGLKPEAYPAVEAVAAFLLACARAELPFKATAGLHLALRHDNPAVGCREYGFLNIFIAALAAFTIAQREHDAAATRADHGDHALLVELLEESDPGAFRFSETALAWRDWVFEHRQILACRTRFAHSFGSCSFAEPLESLREIAMLEARPVA